MSSYSEIFRKMRASELNTRVGGSDPEEVGNFCVSIINRYLPIDQNAKVLDFGCGLGRVALALLQQKPGLKELVGFDIMPDAIEFCVNNIENRIKNTSFVQIEDSNDHYNSYIKGDRGKSKDFIEHAYHDHFDCAYAFSVFTHVDIKDIESLLRFIGSVVTKNGKILFTAFLLTPYSREKIDRDECLFKFARPEFSEGNNLFVGDTADRLAFIAYDIVLLESIIKSAGFAITNIELGTWRGSGFGASLQDVLVITKI